MGKGRNRCRNSQLQAQLLRSIVEATGDSLGARVNEPLERNGAFGGQNR